MASIASEFADFCCELLSRAGPCQARRMFGGWGLSTEGLTLAVLTDLGEGPILWLKADSNNLAQFEAAGCKRFTYPVKGELKSMNYYSAPTDAMESPALMAPWGRLALEAALRARAAKPPKPRAKATPPRKPGAKSKP